MSLLTLPNEILTMIFCCLRPILEQDRPAESRKSITALHSLTLTCRNVRASSTPVLYACISTRFSDIEKLNDTLKAKPALVTHLHEAYIAGCAKPSSAFNLSLVETQAAASFRLQNRWEIIKKRLWWLAHAKRLVISVDLLHDEKLLSPYDPAIDFFSNSRAFFENVQELYMHTNSYLRFSHFQPLLLAKHCAPRKLHFALNWKGTREPRLTCGMLARKSIQQLSLQLYNKASGDDFERFIGSLQILRDLRLYVHPWADFGCHLRKSLVDRVAVHCSQLTDLLLRNSGAQDFDDNGFVPEQLVRSTSNLESFSALGRSANLEIDTDCLVNWQSPRQYQTKATTEMSAILWSCYADRPEAVVRQPSLRIPAASLPINLRSLTIFNPDDRLSEFLLCLRRGLPTSLPQLQKVTLIWSGSRKGCAAGRIVAKLMRIHIDNIDDFDFSLYQRKFRRNIDSVHDWGWNVYSTDISEHSYDDKYEDN